MWEWFWTAMLSEQLIPLDEGLGLAFSTGLGYFLLDSLNLASS